MKLNKEETFKEVERLERLIEANEKGILKYEDELKEGKEVYKNPDADTTYHLSADCHIDLLDCTLGDLYNRNEKYMKEISRLMLNLRYNEFVSNE